MSNAATLLQTAAQSAGSPNLEELDETGNKSENEGFFVKEFFWDKIIVLLTTSIIALTALDILTELLRGGNGVVCFIPDDLNFSDNQADYVTGFCSRRVPDAQYLPIFVLIHGVLIAAWHFIWKSSFSSQFDYFFSLTAHLTRFRDEVTGEYPLKNIRIISRLETDFCTYKKKQIIWWYRVKLVFQFLTAIASILLSFLLFNDFNVDFTCEWRGEGIGADIPCIFASLRLFFLVRIFDTILLGLIILVAVFAFLWTIARHSDELGHSKVALFSFTSGISPEYYQPKPLLSARGLTRLFSPRIQTDFDFLLLALYKTDSGLAHIFKEGQIYKEKKRLSEVEMRYLASYEHIKEEVEPGEVEKKMAPNWIIPPEAKESFKTVDITKALQLPGDIAGAVMGLALHAPQNEYALDISFGSPGFSPALARVFEQVGSLNFDPEYKDENEPIVCHDLPINLTLFQCHSDIFSLGADQNTKFTEMTENEIWENEDSADYVVIGPVDKREYFSILTKLLRRFKAYFTEGAILLVVVPREIEGKKAKKFLSFTPSEKLFKPLDHTVDVSQNRLNWPPQVVSGSPKPPSTSLPLKCGQTGCTFEFKLYKFDPDGDKPKETEQGADPVEEADERKEDTVPLLPASAQEGVAKTESPHLLKKQSNTANVEIQIEPTTETNV